MFLYARAALGIPYTPHTPDKDSGGSGGMDKEMVQPVNQTEV
jgi:hypothetical protein